MELFEQLKTKSLRRRTMYFNVLNYISYRELDIKRIMRTITVQILVCFSILIAGGQRIYDDEERCQDTEEQSLKDMHLLENVKQSIYKDIEDIHKKLNTLVSKGKEHPHVIPQCIYWELCIMYVFVSSFKT
jgi:hypothetical protein